MNLLGDSIKYNSFNNHGIIGLINMPTARLYDESSIGITAYKGTPDQKITLSSFPYDWLEASFFYSNIDGKPYCGNSLDPVCDQDYKDKGFNFKLRLKSEGKLPAIAIGINDIAGTGLYSSEYIVASYGINKTDLHFGLGWGVLNGASSNLKNPLSYINDSFNKRPSSFKDQGGQFEPSRYFSGESVSPFFGISHVLSNKAVLKLEYDTTLTPGRVGYDLPKQDFSLGIEFNISDNFSIGFSNERGNYTSLRFSYKNNPISSNPRHRYKKVEHNKNDDKYKRFIRSVKNNGITVNKIIETDEAIGIELTQFIHPNLNVIEDIIKKASLEAGINKEIKKDLRIADLQGISEYDDDFVKNSELVYQRSKKSKFVTNTGLTLRPYLASREEFFKGAILLENNSEFVIKDNLFFSSNVKFSLIDNFDDFYIPPENTYPAQVRSDVKDYLKNFGEGLIIGRAQLDYHLTPRKNHHIMLTGGILEEMFFGAGLEYLYFKQDLNFGVGFEVFEVKKRDYKMRFGALDYRNTIGHVNFYYRNFQLIPFDAKVSFGEYLAGDQGITLEMSRSFNNGTKFGIFATFTDVSTEQFGEGSFDKGIFFNIPVFGNYINYSWRPLTKDPGAKLIRKHTLYDLLVKFRPIN
tara:strand:- start:3790 stop:5697 length:1908 start_codon:yes stop_codon:yes gene_type:complete